MGSNRLPYFPFHAQDWLNDPVVAGMSAEAEGCYIRLLARSWQSPTPGRVPVGLVAEFGGMHRVPDEGSRCSDMYEAVRSAFDTTSEPRVWIQRRMVLEYEKLEKVYAARRRGAEATNANRDGQRPVTETVSDHSPGVEVEVDLEVEESKSKHSSPNGSGKRPIRPKAPKPVNPIDREWMETFDEVWWPEYRAIKGPGTSKGMAREVWAKIPHYDGQADFDRLAVHFDQAKAIWRKASDVTFIPHPDKWLRHYLKDLKLEAQ